MRFVHEYQHIVFVRKFYDRAQVAADPVVGRVVDENRLCVGRAFDGAFQLGQAHAEGDSEFCVAFGVDVDGDGAAEHQRAHHTAVDVAGKNDLLPRLHGGHHHALHGGSGASHHKKGVVRAEGVGRKVFRIADDGNGVAEVVQRLHGIYVHAHALFAEKVYKFGVAAPALVPGDVEGDHPHFAEFVQSLVNGGAFLCFQIHVRSFNKCFFR